MLAWVDAFNRADVDALAALYHADADHGGAETNDKAKFRALIPGVSK